MSKDIKVSVVVPVYNVEGYLSECLDSLLNQSLKEIEVICVNDGSPDSSLDILKKYAENDNRITIIDQKNQGVSVARNNGMKAANGEYIYIMDSDDFLDLSALEKMYTLAKEQNSDLVAIDWLEYHENGETDHISCRFKGKQLNPYSAWCFMFKKTLIDENKDIKFPAGAHPVEDTTFAFMIFSVMKDFVYLKEPVLYYRQHEEMIMSKINGAKLQQYVDSNAICLKALKEFWNNHPEIHKRQKLIYVELYNCCIKSVKKISGQKLKGMLAEDLLVYQKLIHPISKFFYQNKINKKNKRMIKICKIPVYIKKVK